jgi:hypothetical protein
MGRHSLIFFFRLEVLTNVIIDSDGNTFYENKVMD